ncbi:MAG: PKD domain-containing protein [Flavobacteriaceae bacterium]|jgi:hypothetical protein|nr:PKD domain-containing protein [Flavobacteriaceae bacterium]
MKKQILIRKLFTLGFIFSGIWGIYGQVLINSNNNAIHSGAVLELKSEAKRAGLLMPKVALTSATVWAPVNGNAVNGMTVHNSNNTTQNGLNGKGVYTWTDGRWYLVSSSPPCTSAPKNPILNINGTTNKVDPYTPFLLYVTNPEAGVSYKWTLPSGLIGHSNSNVISVVGVKPGKYTVSVQAYNECGNSNSISQMINVEITLPDIDESGNAQIQGVTCYDVAQTDDTGGSCGSLSSRYPAFNTADKRIRKYLLSLQSINGISDLKVGYTDDANGIIKLVSGNVPGTLSINEHIINVVFADDINTIVKGKGKKATAKIYAIYKENGKEKCVLLTITVQDCSCCPLDYAKIVENAAYKGADIVNANDIAEPLKALNHFELIPNSALCVWKTNQGNAITDAGNLANNWTDANKYCTQTMVANYGESWRLPNIAEMYHNLHKIFYNDGGAGSSSRNGRSRFISSSAQAGKKDYLMYTIMDNTGALKIDNSTLSRINGSLYGNYRCVKTIDYSK